MTALLDLDDASILHVFPRSNVEILVVRYSYDMLVVVVVVVVVVV